MLICFFWQWRDCSQKICASRANCESNILLWGSWKSELYGKQLRTLGCCMTIHAPCHTALSLPVFNQNKNRSGFSASLFSRFEFVWLFSFPEIENSSERISFRNHRQHSESRDEPIEGNTDWGLPTLLQRVGATSPQVYGFR